MSFCFICRTGDFVEYRKLFDAYYGYLGEYKLLRCLECGHIFLQQDFSPEQLTDLYSNYYPRSQFNIESYKPHHERQGFVAWLDGLKSSAFRWVPANVRVLDIGCGFGESLGYHAARGCDVYGVEADENIRRVADKFGFNVRVGLFDASNYESEFFDYITMDQVLEHVTDPREVMQGVSGILKPKGKVVITLPNAQGWGTKVFGKKWINWHAPYHLQFFSKQSMQKLAQDSGLELVSVQTITSSAWLHYQWLHLLTYPQKEQPSGFWAGTACGKKVDLSLRTRIIMRLLMYMHKLKVNHIITRLLDAIGWGDSYVFMLRKP